MRTKIATIVVLVALLGVAALAGAAGAGADQTARSKGGLSESNALAAPSGRSEERRVGKEC